MTPTRDDCIGAMIAAGNKLRRGRGPAWEVMEAAFDALATAGVCVCPIEATAEMITAADTHASQGWKKIWRAMATKGNLIPMPEVANE